MKNIIPFIISGFVLLSCQPIGNTVITPGDKPVIEAYLAPGLPVTMHIFTEIPYTVTDSAISKPIENLQITVTDKNKKIYKLEDLGNGYYTSADNELVGSVGSTYDMSFQHNGRTVSASTIIPPKPTGLAISVAEISRTPLDFSAGRPPRGGGPGGPGGQNENVQIDISWNNPENVYHFVASQSTETNPTPIVKLPDPNQFPNEPNRGNRGFGRGRFNNEPITGTVSQVNTQSFQYFGKQAIILYRLNPDYAALYRSGGTTTQNISTPPTSIKNGLGIFTGVNADTAFINVKVKVL